MRALGCVRVSAMFRGPRFECFDLRRESKRRMLEVSAFPLFWILTCSRLVLVLSMLVPKHCIESLVLWTIRCQGPVLASKLDGAAECTDSRSAAFRIVRNKKNYGRQAEAQSN